MRRLLVSAMAGGLLAAGAWLLPAHADNPTCDEQDDVAVTVPGPGNGFSGGVVCAKGDPVKQEGFIYADGNPDNQEPLDGYIGANSEEGVVGCADGNYEDSNTQHNVILNPPNPPAPPNPNSPCSPKPPA
jgi:hypothetical protein